VFATLLPSSTKKKSGSKLPHFKENFAVFPKIKFTKIWKPGQRNFVRAIMSNGWVLVAQQCCAPAIPRCTLAGVWVTNRG
jgi:hypothetical protein